MFCSGRRRARCQLRALRCRQRSGCLKGKCVLCRKTRQGCGVRQKAWKQIAGAGSSGSKAHASWTASSRHRWGPMHECARAPFASARGRGPVRRRSACRMRRDMAGGVTVMRWPPDIYSSRRGRRRLLAGRGVQPSCRQWASHELTHLLSFLRWSRRLISGVSRSIRCLFLRKPCGKLSNIRTRWQGSGWTRRGSRKPPLPGSQHRPTMQRPRSRRGAP